MKTLKVLLFLILISLNFNPAKADPPTLSAALNTVIKAYLGVKNGLVTNNVTATQNKAMDLVRALDAVPDINMTADQHRLWFDYLNKLVFDSRHINESADINHQREHFSSLSDNMYTILKKFNINTMTLYRQYSPADRYYWISEVPVIKNPYNGIGSSLGKGETAETMKAVFR
jgi:Protein of unknown function (DUF3347)